MIRKNDQEIDLQQEFWETDSAFDNSDASQENAEKKDKELYFPAILLFQITLCLVFAILFILMNTFYPDEYSSMDAHLKQRMSQTVNFKQDGEKAAETIKSLIDKIPADVLPSPSNSSSDSEA